RDQDISTRGLAAESRRQIRDRADRAVVHATFEAYGPDRRVSLRDPDTLCQIPAALAPARAQADPHGAHGDGHPDRTFGRVRHLDRVVEDHHPVAGEALERTLVLDN